MSGQADLWSPKACGTEDQDEDDVALYEHEGHAVEVRPAAALHAGGFVHGPAEVTTFTARDEDGLPLGSGGYDVFAGEVMSIPATVHGEYPAPPSTM